MKKVFKNLPKGIQRSLIVGSVACSLLLGAVFNIIGAGRINYNYLLYVLIFAIPITIIILVAGLWIYSGFKDGKK